MIRTNYDPETDLLHIAFGPDHGHSDTSQEVAPGVYVEYDPDGNPVGIEITSVSLRSRTAVPVAA